MKYSRYQKSGIVRRASESEKRERKKEKKAKEKTRKRERVFSIPGNGQESGILHIVHVIVR